MSVQRCWRCGGDGQVWSSARGFEDCPFKNSDFYGHEPYYSMQVQNEANRNPSNENTNYNGDCLSIFIFFILPIFLSTVILILN